LHCYVAGDPPGVGSNDTCIYVTLVDQFGDGWTGNVSFAYWSEIHGDDTNVITASLDCACPKVVGCIHPFDLNIDQLFHMMVVTADAAGNAYYAWEIHWTAQIVEDGVWKEKYYGGLETTMSFGYSRIPETYELLSFENLWNASGSCNECVEASYDPLGYSSFSSKVVSADKVSTYGDESVSAYLSTSWYITDASGRDVLYTYSDPFCGAGYSGAEVDCGACLPDGSYVFRATGICDPTKDDSRWSFCGVRGGAQEQLEFEMVNGKCYAGRYGGVV
ncbi:unnamed protein product, partial [Symbiodinium microadriaticum]